MSSNSIMSSYIAKLPKKRFSEKELNETIVKYQETECPEALNCLWELLVKWLSKLYHHKRGRNPFQIFTEAEFYSFAFMILMKAAKKFDTTRGVHFTVYYRRLLWGYTGHEIDRVRRERTFVDLESFGESI